MTAVSTKVPASRNNGSAGTPPGGPVPMPRVVGNRRIRTGGIALATMLLAFGAALSGIALISVAKTSSYLGVKQDVPVGSVIQADDLAPVQLSGGGGLTLIPAADISQVVGKRHAAVELKPGTLLSPAELNDQGPVSDDQAVMGIVVKATELPGLVTPGETVRLYPVTANGPKGVLGTTYYDVKVFDISAPGSDGSVSIHIVVSVNDVPAIEQLYHNGGFSVVKVGGN